MPDRDFLWLPYVIRYRFHLAGRQYLLAGLIAGGGEFNKQFFLVHPLFKLVTGTLGSAVREIEHGQFLQAIRVYFKITHVDLFG